MEFQEGTQYDATVTSAVLTHSENTGNPGIQLRFHTDYGPAGHTLWLTEANRNNVLRALEALGFEDPEKFSPRNDSPSLVGAKCLLTFASDTYNDRTRMKVKWINPLAAKVPEHLAARAEDFFGGGGRPRTNSIPDPFSRNVNEVTDEDVPF